MPIMASPNFPTQKAHTMLGNQELLSTFLSPWIFLFCVFNISGATQ